MSKKKILFIEDEVEQISILQERMKAIGYEFLSAINGEVGLKLANEIKPDLILLDIIMPKIDGYEVCRRLKENPETKNIPVIIITAWTAKDFEKMCLQLGAQRVITKPFNTKELEMEIKRLIGK